MINEVYSAPSNISFGSRHNLKKELPMIKNAIKKTLPNVSSPTRLYMDKYANRYINIISLDNNLKYIRSTTSKLQERGDKAEYFKTLFELVRGFKTANCAELAEIAKTTMKINGIQNCDIYRLYAVKSNGLGKPRALDHTIVAVGIPHSKNNKFLQKPFFPSSKTRIIDLWLDDYVGTIGNARDKYSIFGLRPCERLMLAPIKTIEPDKDAINNMKKLFPTLMIKK